MHLDVPVEDAELAADALWQAGANAVEERTGATGRVVLLADADPTRVVLASGWQLIVEEVRDEAWRDAWRAWARPSRVGRLVVQPAWQPDAPTTPGDVVIRLDPGGAFGDGRHPSTRLALAAVEAHAGRGRSVLDVGSGSGVLAVAAALLGADPVVAVDVAPAARDATRANAAANGVRVEVVDDVDLVTARFDLVVANIGAASLRALAPRLVARLTPRGVLSLSGLLETQVADVVSAYPALHRVDVRTEEGWAGVDLRRVS